MTDAALTVMILEDEALLAFDMERTIEQLGHAVMGPFHNAPAALSAMDDALPDIALLDVNLGDGTNSLAVAARLTERAIPFAFLTGYAASKTMIGAEYPHAERLAKPCSPGKLADALARLSA